MAASKNYRNFADLKKNQTYGIDYNIVTARRECSCVAIVAPHGGGIERGTSPIARSIAGDDFNLYLFEGKKPKSNGELHLTSHCFDEPHCLELIKECEVVVTIHGWGCNVDARILLGGLDSILKDQFLIALNLTGIPVEANRRGLMASNANNICNRGKSGKGVQLELSKPLRNSSEKSALLIEALRSVLLCQDVAGCHWP
jgi:phage replication-related protein YjqB (UPF0714/DUF867 family)